MMRVGLALLMHEEVDDMKEWFKAACIRAVRTIAQTAIGTIGGAVILSDVNWTLVCSASILAGLVSILTSLITGLPEVE